MDEIFTVVFSLIGVIIFIGLTYYGARWLNKRVRFTGTGTVKVLEKINLGPDKAIMIIAIGDKYMLLGVTQQHIEKITDLDKADVDNLLNNQSQGKQTFAMQFVNALSAKKQSKGGDDVDKS